MKRIAYLLCACLIGWNCKGGETPAPEVDSPYVLSLPPGTPMPDFPPDNALTAKRVELGKLLFYDRALSRDSSLSCGSCHQPAAAFADHHSISPGIDGRIGFRNSPTLVNVAYHPYYFKEGGSPTLEMQAIGPIENHDEMGFDVPGLIDRLQGNARYRVLAQIAYGRELDIYVVTRALASFQRTLISADAPYDRYRRGDSAALSPAQRTGMQLFFSARTGCSTCHAGFDFSDYAMQNNGLALDYTSDPGRYRISGDSADIGRFKVPTLRNVALSAPYMHDGRVATLDEVLAHYVRGGAGHPNQPATIRPLDLTTGEIASLRAFLDALTDRTFIENPAFRP
ncbi:MAG: cytochrome-c peroxidase [Bacteroidia bacterium]